MSQDERTELMKPLAIEMFGNYIFLKKLASGGMAEVFLARPASLDGNGRVQVVKRILPHVANDSVFLNMFHAEIQVIMGFNHPHTVQLHDFGTINRQPYIAMEYIEGKSLKEVINKFKAKDEKIPLPMVLSLISQAASGLSYAHTFSNKVTGEVVNAIHRDISPHNLMITYEGNLKVIDFGIAKVASSVQEATRAGTIKGKLAYFSPEQISGKPLDARSDVFALGIVAWELLTLKRAFFKKDDSDLTIISRIDNCEQHIVPPSQINGEIPPELDEVILKALKKNPDDRFNSAKDFQIALRQVMVKLDPSYSYSDTGSLISELFAEEMIKDRKELRDLNIAAQNELIRRLEASTFVEGEEESPESFGHGIPNPLKTGPGMDVVNNRLKLIESMMKQKASGKHYVLLAFYILAVFAIQLEGRYSILNYLIPVEEASASSTDSRITKKSQTASSVAAKKRRAAASIAPQVTPRFVKKSSQAPKVADKSNQGTSRRR